MNYKSSNLPKNKIICFKHINISMDSVIINILEHLLKKKLINYTLEVAKYIM